MTRRLPTGKSVTFAGYDIIVFDCDGVLLDSNRFKGLAFAKVLAAHDFPSEEIERFLNFQRANFGTSRFKLFATLIEGRFGAKRNVACETLLSDFGKLCRESYGQQPETAGLREALARASQVCESLYVVSGSDQVELRDVLDDLGLLRTFKKIFGSPVSKVDNLRMVVDDYFARGMGAAPSMLFLGDAMADMDAAEMVGADFVFVAGYSSDRKRVERRALANGWPIVEDLRKIG